MNIGTRIRKIISERGLKQNWVALTAGMSEGALQRVLDNKNAPNAHNLARLSEVLGVSTDYLLGLKDKAS
jgi:transcriptional regulator with XRE-family HTH domain